MRDPARDLVVSQRSFVSHDGTPIGYQVLGREDGIPMLLANGLGGSWRAWSHVVDRFGDTFRFLVWDYRGTYSSGRPITGTAGLSLEAQAKDAVALLEHEGVDHFFAMGWSMGVQVLVEMHRHISPDRFRSLLLHNGVAGRPYDTLFSHSLLTNPFKGRRFGAAAQRTLKAMRRVDGLVQLTVNFAVAQPLLVPLLMRIGLVHHDLDRDLFASMVGGFTDLDMHLYMETLEALGEHDARDQLPVIRCPTLVIAGTHDAMTPMSATESIVEGVRDGRMEVIPGGTHYAAVEMPGLFGDILEEFFEARFPGLLRTLAPVERELEDSAPVERELEDTEAE